MKPQHAYLTLLLVVLAAAPVSAADMWWAFASGYRTERGGYAMSIPVYGAAWNYPTQESAEKAALAECQKQWMPCAVYHVGKNACFAVGSFEIVPDGFDRTYEIVWGKTKAELRESIAHANKYSRFGEFKIDMAECSGAE